MVDMYSRKKIAFRPNTRSEEDFFVEAYPLKDDFFPPFKFVAHHYVTKTAGRVEIDPTQWVISEVITGRVVFMPQPLLRQAIKGARELLQARGAEAVGQVIGRVTLGVGS